MKFPVKKLLAKAIKWVGKEIEQEIEAEVDKRVSRRVAGLPPVGFNPGQQGDSGPGSP